MGIGIDRRDTQPPSSLSDLAVCSDQRERTIEKTPAAGPSDQRERSIEMTPAAGRRRRLGWGWLISLCSSVGLGLLLYVDVVLLQSDTAPLSPPPPPPPSLPPPP